VTRVISVERVGHLARSLGIEPAESASLLRATMPFVLPAAAPQARWIIDRLNTALEQIVAVHSFVSGLGLSAPQLGVAYAAVVVHEPDGRRWELLNPRVVDRSSDSSEDYEACLSSFRFRGAVPRSVTLSVEHQSFDGAHVMTTFSGRTARLVAHEIDHLRGILYADRMRPGVLPVQVGHYEAGE
jgi:peptide deformylase